jgi:hypothetical protein
VFKAYVLDGEEADAVAARFGMKKNAVYQVRARMLARLQNEVAMLRDELEG